MAAVEKLHEVDPCVMSEVHFCDIIQHGLTERYVFCQYINSGNLLMYAGLILTTHSTSISSTKFRRCHSTKTATVRLICAKWTKAAKFDPVELVRMMRATLIEDECEKALKVVLEAARSGDRSAIDELSDPEIRSFLSNTQLSMIQLNSSDVVFDEYQIFFTRIACATAKESADLTPAQKEALMAKVAPDIPTLCDIFQKHLIRLVESVQEEDEESEDQEFFVCAQLLRLAKVAGLQEEGSRRHFASVIATVLSSHETPDSMVDVCVETLVATNDSDFDFLDMFAEVFSNLAESPRDGRIRLLSIFSIVLENGPSSLSSHTILADMEKIVFAAINDSTSSDEEREIAIHCLGQLGLFSLEMTVLDEYKPLLLEAAASKEETMQCRGHAMLALSDLALLFPRVLQPLQFENGSTLSFASLMEDMMMHRNRHFSSLVAEVAAKLLFSGRVCDSSLLARLLVLYFDPSKPCQEDEDAEITEPGNPQRMQQLLSLFFPTFAVKSEVGRNALIGSIQCALEVSLKPLSKKSKKRPLAFPMVKMVEYICSVVMASIEAIVKKDEADNGGGKAGTESNGSSSPSTGVLAGLQVARFIAQKEGELTVTQLRSLSKFVGNQDIEPSDFKTVHLRHLKECVEELEEIVSDATSLRGLRPVMEALSKVEAYQKEDDDDDEDVDDDHNEALSEEDTVSESSNVGKRSGEKEEDDETMSEGETGALGDKLVQNRSSGLLDKENALRFSGASTKKGRQSRRSRSLKSSLGSQVSAISVLESVAIPNS